MVTLVLKAPENPQVGIELLRQLTHVALFEGTDLLFFFLQGDFKDGELMFDELGSSDGLLFSGSQVLLDKEGRQPIGHFHDLSWVHTPMGDRERVRNLAAALCPLNLDIDGPTQHLYDLFHSGVRDKIGIEVELFDHFFEVCPTEDLLAQRMQPVGDR